MTSKSPAETWIDQAKETLELLPEIDRITPIKEKDWTRHVAHRDNAMRDYRWGALFSAISFGFRPVSEIYNHYTKVPEHPTSFWDQITGYGGDTVEYAVGEVFLTSLSVVAGYFLLVSAISSGKSLKYLNRMVSSNRIKTIDDLVKASEMAIDAEHRLINHWESSGSQISEHLSQDLERRTNFLKMTEKRLQDIQKTANKVRGGLSWQKIFFCAAIVPAVAVGAIFAGTALLPIMGAPTLGAMAGTLLSKISLYNVLAYSTVSLGIANLSIRSRYYNETELTKMAMAQQRDINALVSSQLAYAQGKLDKTSLPELSR